MNSDERFYAWLNDYLTRTTECREYEETDLHAAWDEQQKRVDMLEVALRRCAIELAYVQDVEAGLSTDLHKLYASGEGRQCIEIAEKLLGPMREWPEIKEDKPL